MKKILIIGCNSFSGSNFTNLLLQKNYQVYGVSRSNRINNVYLRYTSNKKIKNFKFYKLNINYEVSKIIFIIKKYKISYIVNFAAQGMVNESWKNPLDWYRTNLISSVNLVEKLKELRFIKKFLQISTPEVYGNNTGLIYEESKFEPSTPYAVSRASFDFHLINLYKNFNFPAVVSRAANVYGPGQALYRIIPKTFIYLYKKKKIKLDGLGNTLRSFIYIDDIVNAYFILLTRGKNGQTYNISNNKFISIKKLVATICNLKKKSFNKNVELIKRDRIGKDLKYKLSNRKLKKQFKFKFKTSMNTGLKHVDDWIIDNRSILFKEKTWYVHKK